VSPDSDDVIAYPIARPNDLTVGDFYRDLQQQGPIPVQLPFGEPCWLATRYHDV
jgi:cytochrome P450 RapN/nocardicin N-oxygenase